MAWKLRTLTTLQEVWNLIPGAYMAANNCLDLKDLTPSHRHRCWQNTNANEIKKNKKRKKLFMCVDLACRTPSGAEARVQSPSYSGINHGWTNF